MITVILVLLFSLAAPLPLLVVEKFLPYPFVVEELIKLIFVLILISEEKKLKKNLFPVVVICGILFSISESIFYLLNILALQTYSVFFERIIFTGIVHISTFIIILFFARKKKYWWILGFMIAIIIHFLYNYLMLKY